MSDTLVAGVDDSQRFRPPVGYLESSPIEAPALVIAYDVVNSLEIREVRARPRGGVGGAGTDGRTAPPLTNGDLVQ